MSWVLVFNFLGTYQITCKLLKSQIKLKDQFFSFWVLDLSIHFKIKKKKESKSYTKIQTKKGLELFQFNFFLKSQSICKLPNRCF